MGTHHHLNKQYTQLLDHVTLGNSVSMVNKHKIQIQQMILKQVVKHYDTWVIEYRAANGEKRKGIMATKFMWPTSKLCALCLWPNPDSYHMSNALKRVKDHNFGGKEKELLLDQESLVCFKC